MSDYLKKYRTKYPKYQDIDDARLSGALYRKYASETGQEIGQDAFNQKIGYIPAVETPLPSPEPLNQADEYQAPAPLMGDDEATFGETSANVAAGAGERAGDLGAGYLKTMESVAQKFGKYFVHGGDPRAEAVTGAIFKRGIDALEGIDLGYEEKTNFQGVKEGFKQEGALSAKAWGNVLEFGFEQGVKSVPDMIAVMGSLPQYILARSGEMGTERAINKGKEKAELVDILEATPFALGSALFERIGAKGMTSDLMEDAGKEMLKAGIKESAKRVSKAGGSGLSKEAATEAMQEGIIEYAGEKYGTDAKMYLQESIDRGLGGALAGGVMGGSVATTVSATKDIAFDQEKVIAKALEAEIEATELQDAKVAADDQFTQAVKEIRSKKPTDKTMGELVMEKKADIIEARPQPEAKEDVVLDKGSLPEQGDKPTGSGRVEPVLSDEIETQEKPVVAKEPVESKPKAEPVDVAKPKQEPSLEETTDKPLAAEGLNSYRYKGRYGWIMIGGKDVKDALNEANRSIEGKEKATIENLQSWDGKKYQPVKTEKPSKMEAFEVAPKTESNAFKNWFGDSKVVDKKKKPIVVYHGTHKDFEEFSLKGRNGQRAFGDGFYFTPDKKRAESFASMPQEGKGRVMETYLSLKNPYVVKSMSKEHNALSQLGLDKGSAAVKEWVENKGYDGVIFKASTSGNIVEYIVFDPTQVKSVDNQGTFSKSDPNIYKSARPKEAPLTKDQSKMVPAKDVALSTAIVDFEGAPSIEKQSKDAMKKQTKADVAKEKEAVVKEPSMDEKGDVTYPQPEEDINTKEYMAADKAYSKDRPSKTGPKVFHAPGHNYTGLMRSSGLPSRKEVVTIEGKAVRVPEAPQRIEPIMRELVGIIGRRIYFGKIKGKSTEGFYMRKTGEVRTRKKNDVEVLAHEMAHYLDFYSNETLPNFRELYMSKPYVEEVKGLSYTDDARVYESEGFAEFTRLWLTNGAEAEQRAPAFYKAFNKLLATDKKLAKRMGKMQELMHKFFFQGADKMGQALIGQDRSFIQQWDQWAYRRDSRIRQQTIDRFHAARKIEQELTGKIGVAKESAWKQLRLANGGAEGISDYIMNYGTLNFDEKGDLVKTGKSLHDVFEPVKSIKKDLIHKKDSPIDLLMRYFAGRRALELHSQGRENLIPMETAKEWARLGGTYKIFDSIHKEYQAFNSRMMDFYETSGMVSAEGRAAMEEMNKDYVPFNRIRDQLAGSKNASPAGFQRLKGGTANLNDILVNIQDGIVANVRSALNNRAKQRLYQYISSHKDGSIFATKLGPDSKPVKVYKEDMQAKVKKILEQNGVMIEGKVNVGDAENITFWQHGVKPTVNESGNMVDTVIIDGKPRYYEVQDPLLQDMLLSMNPESYSSFMNIMFGIKNFFTRTITLGIEFTGANLVRDTVGATFLSKNGFVPFIDSFKGMYSFIAKDKYYQDFIRSGGGHSSRIEAMTKEGSARRRVKLDEFGVMTGLEKLLSTTDNIMSAFEYGTRIGEFRIAKKNKRSDMDAAFAAREISTDFSVTGANRFLTGYIRTVPFLNAMIQSQDRVFREAFITKKYDGNPTRMAMTAFLGLTIPTLALYLINKDDEDYKAIPDYEKRTNWHFKVGKGRYVKIPRPYDVGFAYATMPELYFKYLEDEKGKEFADGMLWTLTQMYGIDGVPAMMTGWWDLVKNEKWTGAPVVPSSMEDVEAPEQYTSNTSETFIRLGEALGVSPIKAEHMFKAYTGYLGGYIMSGTDHLLWDEDKFGEKPDMKPSQNVFLRRFLTPDVRPATTYMEKFFDLKEKSDVVVSTFKQKIDIRRGIKGKTKGAGKFKDDKFFGLSGEEKKVLFGLNDSMNKLIKLMYGKNGIKTAELAIKYNKNISGKEKREKLDQLWRSRNKAFMQYYNQANKAMEAAKAKQEN